MKGVVGDAIADGLQEKEKRFQEDWSKMKDDFPIKGKQNVVVRAYDFSMILDILCRTCHNIVKLVC